MTAVVGIDLGNQFCRTAMLRGGDLSIVETRYSSRPLPWELELIAEEEAEAPKPRFRFSGLKQELAGWHAFRTLGGSEDTVIERLKEILANLRDDLAAAADDDELRAVLTVPGFLTEAPRSVLRDAALGVGFQAVRLLDEAAACALAFTRAQPPGNGELPAFRNLLVYSLGAGSFTATVVGMEAGGPVVAGCEGERLLGGIAFDAALMELIQKRLGEFAALPDAPEFFRWLQALAQSVKTGLSRRNEETFEVDLTAKAGSGGTKQLTVGREEFEAAIQPVVERTIELSRMAIEAAGLSPEDVDCVLKAGRSTRVPLVERRLGELCGKAAEQVPELAAAQGAAWFGGQLREQDWSRRQEPDTTHEEADLNVLASIPQQAAHPEPVPPAAHPVPSEAPARRLPSPGEQIAALIITAEKHWDHSRHEDAIEMVKAADQKLHELTSSLCLAFGQGLLASGSRVRAVSILGDAVRYLEKGYPERRRALQLYHQSLNAYARQLAEEQKWEEAKRIIRAALSLNPQCEHCRQVERRIREGLRMAVQATPRRRPK